MKAKTIKAILKQKLKEWTETITDERVRELVQKDTIITGGSIASMFLEEKVRDFDVYFRTHETVYAVADYYCKKFNETNPQIKASVRTFKDRHPYPRISLHIQSAGIASENQDIPNYQYFEQADPDEGLSEEYIEEVMKVARTTEKGKDKYRPIFLSSNAITLANKIQIVIRFWGEPDEIHENFDFVHCTNFWTVWDNKLTLNPEALECLLAKEIRYMGSRYPLCSIVRTRKFVRRGWSIHAGQYLKMCMQLGELDLTDVNTLEEQMTGVDVAYFYEILAKVKEKKDITAAYVIEIIDKMM